MGVDEEKGLEVIDYFEATGIDEKYVAFVLFLQWMNPPLPPPLKLGGELENF